MPKIDYNNFRHSFGQYEPLLPQPFRLLPSGSPYALLSGSLAASASLFAKLAVDSRTTELATFLETHMTTLGVTQSLVWVWTLVSDYAARVVQTVGLALTPTQLYAYVLRGCFVGLIFACNALMWAMFSKALHKADSSVTVTVYNTAVNFCLTAVLGRLAFNEPLCLRWWFGASLILLGSVLMSQSSSLPLPPSKASPSQPQIAKLMLGRRDRNHNRHPPCRLNSTKEL
ncbi:hypothetical protein IWQ62_006753 [Dispira parvispora]|uniref:EamA domain-containing protein n=1 Tax=Dispira parvispora TaxID=1520584 RepID=A0A9W8AG18_9FUNG|nr:hypothetical protein IWQ62_006753 [Dispira parvispora]